MYSECIRSLDRFNVLCVDSYIQVFKHFVENYNCEIPQKPYFREQIRSSKHLCKGHNSAKNHWMEQNVNLICNSSLYTHIPNIKSISPSIAKKVVTTKYLAKFQGPRDITRPKIIGPERNVNLICNLLLYIHIPNIKSISQSIAKTRGSAYWACIAHLTI
jgi:hypothetical protein